MAKLKINNRAPRPGLLDRIHLAMSTGRYIDGIWVGSWRTPSDLGRIEDALLLIKQYDPVQYFRLVRELTRVWVFVLTHASAQYKRSLNACILDERYVADSAPERIASTIVHEATHARIARCGIEYEEGLRSRIEAVCFRRELAFAAKLPNGATVREELMRYLDFYSDNAEYFSNKSVGERDNEGAIEALRYANAPDWMIKIAPTARAVMSWLRRLFRSAA